MFINKKEWQVLLYLIKIFEILPSIKLQAEVYITLPTALLYIYTICNKLNMLMTEFDELQEEIPELVGFFKL